MLGTQTNITVYYKCTRGKLKHNRIIRGRIRSNRVINYIVWTEKKRLEKNIRVLLSN